MSQYNFTVNLGGEGEIPDVLNQQGSWLLGPSWASSAQGKPLAQLVAEGHAFLICPNDAIALPDSCVDTVITNSVPIDKSTWLGPGVQSSEIKRILKSGGVWIKDGHLEWTKP